MTESAIVLEDGKYIIRHNNGANLRTLRNGLPWREHSGDKLFMAMVNRIEELEARLKVYTGEEDRDLKLRFAVSTFFPAYDGRRAGEFSYGSPGNPIRHPLRLWWWNGASIVDYSVNSGECYVEVESYVGGGESDTFDFTFPSDWLDLPEEEMVETIQNWCVRKKAQKDEKDRIKAIKKAERDIIEANKKLSALCPIRQST